MDTQMTTFTKAATVAWYELQAALAQDYAERKAATGFAPTQPFVRSTVVDLAAVRARHAKVHAENAAWVASLEGRQ